MRVVTIFTFFFFTVLFYGLFSEGEFSPALEKMGGIGIECTSIGTVSASVISPPLALKEAVLPASDSVVRKNIDSVLAKSPIISCEENTKIRSKSSKSTVKTGIKNTQKKKKRKVVEMERDQKKSMFKESFGELILERCVVEGLASETILSSEYLKKQFMDTSIHFIVLVSLPGQESGYNPFIKNTTSTARGFYQFINSTGKQMCKELGIPVSLYDPQNPYQNVVMGVHLYANSFKKFRSVNWAIAAHYHGEGAVREIAKYYGGIEKDPFVKAVRGIMRAGYKNPPKEAYEYWQEEFLAYNCLDCKDYYASLRDTIKIQIVDTSLTNTNAEDTIKIPLVVREKTLATKERVSRTFF